MTIAQTFDFKDARQLMSDAKFYEGYSRFIPELNRYETWNEAVKRVMDMHRTFFTQKGKMSPELEQLIQQAQESYERKEFLGAQRALQFGGEQLLKHHGKLYNCIGTPIDRVEAFGEIMYWGLCGCGVGYSVQNHHISRLPKIVPRPKQAKIHVIQDSIEGWAEAIDVLLSSFFENGGKHPEFLGRKIYFDKSKIREKGALISGGFLAPGPEPLMNALNKIENMLIRIAEEKRQLKSVECYDIICHSFDAVLSGGVRRCLPEFYQVETDSGWKNISEVTTDDFVILPEGKFKVKSVFDQGKQNTVKIITKDGFHASTSNHHWLIFDKTEKKLVWMTPEELSINPTRYAMLKSK